MNEKEYKVSISGLICPQCEDEVEDALIQTKGIIKADVSYFKSSATVTYDPDIINDESINTSISDAGYFPGGNRKYGIITDIISVICTIILVFLIPWITGLVKVPKLQDATTLGAVFLIGLLTGVHCIGMCGGIMLSQSGKEKSSRKISPFLYNLGRIISYTLVGGILGFIGKSISYTTDIKSMVITISGLLVFICGLKMWGIPYIRNLSLTQRKSCELPNGIRRGLSGRPLLIGLATGLMPCGALSAAWMIAASSGSIISGAAHMFMFSIGTVPALLIFGLLGSFIPKKYNKYITKVSTILVTSMGLALIIKGIQIIV